MSEEVIISACPRKASSCVSTGVIVFAYKGKLSLLIQRTRRLCVSGGVDLSAFPKKSSPLCLRGSSCLWVSTELVFSAYTRKPSLHIQGCCRLCVSREVEISSYSPKLSSLRIQGSGHLCLSGGDNLSAYPPKSSSLIIREGLCLCVSKEVEVSANPPKLWFPRVWKGRPPPRAPAEVIVCAFPGKSSSLDIRGSRRLRLSGEVTFVDPLKSPRPMGGNSSLRIPRSRLGVWEVASPDLGKSPPPMGGSRYSGSREVAST